MDTLQMESFKLDSINKEAFVPLDMSQTEGALDPIEPSSVPVLVKCKIFIIVTGKEEGNFKENSSEKADETFKNPYINELGKLRKAKNSMGKREADEVLLI